MIMKIPKVLFIFTTFLMLLTASMPVKNSIPTELASSIEKKWPGSTIVLVPDKAETEKSIILYKIVLNNNLIGWAYTRRVLSCRNGGCDGSNSTVEMNVSHEYFDYYALLNPKFSILEIKVYNYAATHGQEICSKAWLRQFTGYNGSKQLRYGKDIDAISGATISGIALTEDVGIAVKTLRE
jgi:hypothetical protein